MLFLIKNKRHRNLKIGLKLDPRLKCFDEQNFHCDEIDLLEIKMIMGDVLGVL